MGTRGSKPFSRPPLELLEISGTPREVAHQVGKRRERIIAGRIEFWDRHLGTVYSGKKDRLRSLETAFLKEAEKQAPDYVEEIRAMAEGAGVSFSDLFRLNLTELVPFADKCTDLIFLLQTSAGKRILITHNEDWDPRRNDVFILKARLPDVTCLTLAYDGYLPGLSAGRNSFGLCHSVNYLRPLDFKIGLPRIFITRFLLAARNIKECLQHIGKKKRAFGQSIHLAQEDRYVNVELTARRMALRHPRLPAVHSNHYLALSLKKNVPSPLPSSRERQGTAQRLLREKVKGKTMFTPKTARHFAKEILSDRSGHPYAVWREADSSEETSATLATVFVGTDSKMMDVFRGRPLGASPLSVDLEETEGLGAFRRRGA